MAENRDLSLFVEELPDQDLRLSVGCHYPTGGMMRRINASKSGTVKAVSPCPGLKIIPFAISEARVGAN